MLKKFLVSLVIITCAILASSDIYEAGTTTFDYQMNGAMGNRVAVDEYGNAHICWMHSDSTEGWFPDRCIHYNYWDASTEAFYPGGSVKASGSRRAGYTTMGLLSNGRAVVAFHEYDSTADLTYSVVTIDAAPGAGAFSDPVVIDTSTVPAQPIWPHIVVGADDAIHVTARVNDTGPAGDTLYYSRSTDAGASFSNWIPLTDNVGNDAAMAVSREGSKVCIAWMAPVDLEGGGTAFRCGHIYYTESVNSGQDWSEPVKVTDGRYTDLLADDLDAKWLLANWRDIDCAYDANDEVVIAWTEGLHTYDSQHGLLFYPRQWARSVIWFESSGIFGCPTAGFPMFYNVDTLTGDTLWESDSLGLWGVPVMAGDEHGGQYGPQLAAWGSNMICVFGGQYDSLDLSGGGTVNGDIYGTTTLDDGATWHPLTDYDPSKIGTVWERITNMTRTDSYGAGPGSCFDEDYHTIWPWVDDDDIIHLTYIQDKFSGSIFPEVGQPVITTNPVEYYRYDLNNPPGVEETPDSPVQVTLSPFIARSPARIDLSSALTQNGELRIRNVLGQTVRRLELEAGAASITWDGCDEKGLNVPVGVYFVELRTESERSTAKLTLVR